MAGFAEMLYRIMARILPSRKINQKNTIRDSVVTWIDFTIAWYMILLVPIRDVTPRRSPTRFFLQNPLDQDLQAVPVP